MILSRSNFGNSDWSSFIQLFETQAERYRYRTLIRYQPSHTKFEFKTLTYGQVNSMANYLARHWRPQLDGVQCIAFLGGNPLQSVLAMLATSKLGIAYFPLSTGNSATANAHLLTEANVQYLIASEEYSQKADASVKHLEGVRVHIWKSFDPEQLAALAVSSNEKFPSSRPALSDIVLVLHSSGTTGFPKPIHLSNQWLLLTLAILPGHTKPNGDPLIDGPETIMTTFSAFHTGGVWMYWLPITMGGSVVVLRNEPPSSADFLSVIRKHTVTGMMVSPVHLEGLARLLQSQGIDEVTRIGLNKIKFCVYGGAPLANEVGEFLKSNGLNIGNGYGATEVSNIALARLSKDDKNYLSVKPHDFSFPYIKWEPYDNNGLYHLMIWRDYPGLSPTAMANIAESGYYETKDLFQEDPPKSGYWRYIRRIDDIIVLSDGGKTDPIFLENEIRNASIVKHCLVVGHNRSNTAVLVELDDVIASERSLAEINSEVYNAVRIANRATAQKHSHIVVPDMVYILPPDRHMPTAVKGNVARKKAIQEFEKEIDKMYDDFIESLKSFTVNT